VTEIEAQLWLADVCAVSRETMAKLDALRQMVVTEALQQNLISAASLAEIWARHIVDSAQLAVLAGGDKDGGAWLDMGTGAGFPGLVVALLRDSPMILVESRRRRADFLESCVSALDLRHVTVHAARIETIAPKPCAFISARAFAPLPKLLSLGYPFSRKETVWLLPKGKSAQVELESIAKSWQGSFQVAQSVTEANAEILVGSKIKPVGKR
jgi:16S rRNA (guanine527-N7)-methyltransferase